MKPMLAGKVSDLATQRFPMMISPKLDGIRAIVKGGVVLSRNLKPIPNQYVQRLFSRCEGYDGELIVGDPTDPAAFRASTSGVMSQDGEPDVHFFVFDRFDTPDVPWVDRYGAVRESYAVIKVEHRLVQDSERAQMFEEQFLSVGYEGAMLRDPFSKYKFGRSTEREGYLLKLKRFEDSEAWVIGLEEKVHNGNEATINALGYMERSSHLENRVPLGTMGALIVRDVKTNVQFNIGTGFSDEERTWWWQRYNSFDYDLLNTTNSDGSMVVLLRQDPFDVVKYRFFPSGSKDKPRFPSYLGIRK